MELFLLFSRTIMECAGLPLVLPFFKYRSFTNGLDTLLSPVAHDVWCNCFVLTFSLVLVVRNQSCETFIATFYPKGRKTLNFPSY